MIDSKELRIGNLFYPIGRNSEIHMPIPIPIEICALGRFEVETLRYPGNVLVEGIIYKIADLSPIPLTPEILAKCGFDKSSYLQLNYGIGICAAASNTVGIVGGLSKYARLGNYYSSLHQLQNLYFALTGEELTIEF